ncbi:unnamed protein product [Lactuca virosa]|uniref:Uncharacterized protein n=1 Tax=Lactuca virosa TaxID=75947 RepID=A0AAU9N9R4_9ASTR|nr:unnamed protein product [Lactuca virosa]
MFNQVVKYTTSEESIYTGDRTHQHISLQFWEENRNWCDRVTGGGAAFVSCVFLVWRSLSMTSARAVNFLSCVFCCEFEV